MLADLKLSSCRIVHTDSPIVLLCGGPVKIKERPNDPDPAIRSLRHAITLEQTEFELFRPEEITTWQEDSVFKNLVDFETELAAICSLVVIILESPGSIAELGAFSQLDELRAKLVVIKCSKFSERENKSSFINLGILRHIKETNSRSVKTFPWDISRPHEIEKDTIEDAVNGIGDSLSEIHDTQVLSSEQESHGTTLVCELIRIFVALKRVEIIEYVNLLGFNMSKEKVRRKLFLLENFHLIKAVEYDGATYYCRTNSRYHKLRLSASEGRRLEDVSIILDCNSYYGKSKDRHRLGAIKRFKRENTQ
ncbi:retron St85 family effector protein [Pseudomonadota bacterium]